MTADIPVISRVALSERPLPGRDAASPGGLPSRAGRHPCLRRTCSSSRRTSRIPTTTAARRTCGSASECSGSMDMPFRCSPPSRTTAGGPRRSLSGVRDLQGDRALPIESMARARLRPSLRGRFAEAHRGAGGASGRAIRACGVRRDRDRRAASRRHLSHAADSPPLPEGAGPAVQPGERLSNSIWRGARGIP